MPAVQVIKIEFGKEGIWVRTETSQWRFDEAIEALGFACKIREEERDQPCILLPPNAFLSFAKDLPTQTLWDIGVKEAEQLLATAA